MLINPNSGLKCEINIVQFHQKKLQKNSKAQQIIS